jgi:photosystem II stability/assembly factor-like uncharacterized protein
MTGYIVGTGGVIFKSVDYGQTWVQQTSPTTQSLRDVFFSDDTHGFAVGVGGTIIYTTDGTNWSIHPQSSGGSGTPLTANTLNSVCFVGSSGWMGGGADNVKAELYLTTDGGTTWTAVAAANNPSTDMCNSLSFFDANKGYAACDGRAPSIIYTNDGGVTWNASTLNLGPYSYTRTDIECILAGNDANTAFAGGWGSLVGPQPTIILVTHDGGATFNTPDPTYPWKTYAYGYGLAKFTNGDVVLVGGNAVGSAAIAVRASSPYSSWAHFPSFFGYTLDDACAVPGTNLIVAVGTAGCIALSKDRGATWTFQYKPGTRFQGVEDFADAGVDRVYASASGGTILDFDVAHGTVRHRVASPENWGPVDMYDIDYVVNPKKAAGGGATVDSSLFDVVFACGSNNYLVKSYDHGITWTQLQHTTSNYDAITGMYWFTPDTGIVVGNIQKATSRRAEVIYKTVDGGATLDTVLVRVYTGLTSYQYFDVDFAPDNRNIGVVVGTTNKIRYTTDGGASWHVATENIADSTIGLQDVCMIDHNVGWACGDKGALIKTTDGGATWTAQTVPWGAINLRKLDYRTPTWIYVVGESDLCYYTTDGGTNWTNISPVGYTKNIHAVYYQGTAGILWIGGRDADVQNRADGVAGTDTPKGLPYALNQNYPNPFNPSTTIAFTLPIDDHVTLNVYDVTGKLVATVMNKDMKAGTYSVGFKADGLASGVYFYRLKTSTLEETRKMILLR